MRLSNTHGSYKNPARILLVLSRLSAIISQQKRRENWPVYPLLLSRGISHHCLLPQSMKKRKFHFLTLVANNGREKIGRYSRSRHAPYINNRVAEYSFHKVGVQLSTVDDELMCVQNEEKKRLQN